MRIKVGLGQDSHVFVTSAVGKPLILGGVKISFDKSLAGNSDADVVLHAICRAISSVSGTPIIGAYSDKLCKEHGITDSAVYFVDAVKTLDRGQISHIAVTIECSVPRVESYVDRMRSNIAELARITVADVGISASSGEGLTSFGRGEGIQCFALVTVVYA